jgi:4-hydroxybenzoate polyprenyltransferase
MLRALIKTLRPKQWTKNLFVFAALVFDGKLFQRGPLLRTVAGFVLFCLISSTVYVINDLVDIEKDRQHPIKRHRPLASGRLSPRVAILAAVLIAMVCLPLAVWLDWAFGLVAIGYVAVMIPYSFWLKNIVIIDVMTIAAGFVLRVVAGVTLVHVVRFSPWLYVCTTLLALFLAVGKRRHELFLLQGNANGHRAILSEYSMQLINEMISILVSTTIIAYSLYTFSAPNLPTNHLMMLTIPFVLFGLFRYLYLLHVKNEGGAPEDIVVKDRPMMAALGLWGLAVVLVLYFA